MDKILNDIYSQMDEVVSLAKEDINAVRVGRAKPSLVENVLVEAYGTKMHIKELASISAPDPHSLFVKPWDEGILGNIAKGIMAAALGLSPVVDKNMIRINIPSLTGEQREELAKLVDQKAESARVMVRQVRSAGKVRIESEKGKPGISEDDIHNATISLQSLTDRHTAKIDEIAEEHKKDITTL